jgi:hypothetical protein
MGCASRFHHFESNEALFETEIRQVEDDLLKAVRAAAGSESDSRTSLAAASESSRSTELVARSLFAAVCELALQSSNSRPSTAETDEVVDLLISAL